LRNRISRSFLLRLKYKRQGCFVKQNMDKREIICVAVDIEKTGDRLLADRIISVGLHVGTKYGETKKYKKFNFLVEWFDLKAKTNGDFDPICVDEFWSKQSKEVIRQCQENPEPLERVAGWKAFRKYIDDLEDEFPNEQYKIVFLTDNASFDIASIDRELEQYGGFKLLRRTHRNYKNFRHNFRSVIAADDMFKMLSDLQQETCQAKIDAVVKHDHNSLNDAHCIYLQYVEAMRIREGR